jgi:hypothetical protein
MADVYNTATHQRLKSVNTPDYTGGDWILTPPEVDVLEAANVPPQYRKWDGSTVLEMTQAEKDAVDAAVEQSNEDAAVAEYDSDVKLKALALTVLQLVNTATGNSYTIEQFKTFLRSNYNG